MKFEIPEFKRCCFCVPLRYGLLAWAYLTLVPTALLVTSFSFEYKSMVINRACVYIICITVLIIVMLGNFIATVLLIVAAHNKSIKLLKLYKAFSFGLTLTNIILMLTHFISELVFGIYYNFCFWYWQVTVVILSIWMFYNGIQMYIIALVRSEIIKLESNQGFQFSNIAAKAENSYYEPKTIKIENVAVETEKNKLREEIQHRNDEVYCTY